MIPELRQRYNAAFTEQQYAAFLDELATAHRWGPDFRVAETPLFLDAGTAGGVRVSFGRRPFEGRGLAVQIRNVPPRMAGSSSSQMSKFRPTQSMWVVLFHACPVYSL